MDENGLVRLPPKPPRRKIPAGAKVKIAAGPFQGVTALYAGMSHGEREVVLIAMLGRQAKVELRPGQIA